MTPFAAQAEVVQGREYVEKGWYTNEANLKRLFNGMSLILTYRSSGSQTKMGDRMSAAERKQVQDDYAARRVSAATIQRTLEGLPRDLLFVYRCTNIVRSINKSLATCPPPNTISPRACSFAETRRASKRGSCFRSRDSTLR